MAESPNEARIAAASRSTPATAYDGKHDAVRQQVAPDIYHCQPHGHGHEVQAGCQHQPEAQRGCRSRGLKVVGSPSDAIPLWPPDQLERLGKLWIWEGDSAGGPGGF